MPQPKIFFTILSLLFSSSKAFPESKRSVTCPDNFRNVVFNSGVNSEANFTGRFQNIQTIGGVDKWIGFTDEPPSNGDANIDAHQLRIIMGPDNVQEGVGIVTGSTPPDYIEIFNEPDLADPVVTPAQAAQAVLPLLNLSTSTQYISPASAFPGTSWLPEFFGNCSCLNNFPIISAHIYNPDPQQAIGLIESVHNQFPNNQIWITEISPWSAPSQDCTLDDQGVIDWQNTVLDFAAGSGYVERIFWNSGEYGYVDPNNPTVCNPSLTNNDTAASGTALLTNYGQLCS